MISPLKKKIALLIAVVYTLFACCYVVLCSRDTAEINLAQTIKLIFAKQGGKPAAPVDAIASKKGPVRSKFLSRPRVITQKMAAPDFSAVAFLFLLLFTVFFSFPKQNLLFLPIFSLPDPYPGIVFFNNWRI